MGKTKKAFSLFELVLLLAALGLIACAVVPAVAVFSRQSGEKAAVAANLEKIVEAGKKYNSDNGTDTADYVSLVDGKYLEPLKSIAGESYDGVSITDKGGVAEVSTKDGAKVSKKY